MGNLARRMYYNKTTIDTSFPAPSLVMEVNVPSIRPKKGGTFDPVSAAFDSAEERLRRLQEIKTHMDLLNDFKDIADADFVAKRKQELFRALPAAPPSGAPRKRARKD